MIDNRDAINSEAADRGRRHERRIADLEKKVSTPIDTEPSLTWGEFERVYASLSRQSSTHQDSTGHISSTHVEWTRGRVVVACTECEEVFETEPIDVDPTETGEPQ